MALPHVLVVDDDAAICRTLRRLLLGAAEVTTVGTASAARAVLERGVPWALLSFDLELPDGSGWELAAAARALYPDTHILILTGCGGDGARRRAAALGAEYLQKPVTAERLAGLRGALTQSGRGR